MSHSQLNKLKSELKNGTEVTLNLSSNVIGDSNDETNFPHKLLITDTRVSRICKAFANGSKTQLSKIIQLRGFNHFDLVLNPPKAIYEIVSKVQDLANKVLHDKLDKLVQPADTFRKIIPDYNIIGSGITLTKLEIRYIIKVIRSLENRKNFLKETTKKITSQEGRFLNFLRTLMTAVLPLMENVLTPLVKSVFVPL